MGYYTRFECQTETTEEQEIELSKIAGYSIECMFEGDGDIKWYTFEEDVQKWSKLYPSQLFEWWGEGEGQGDSWRTYFKNGKYKCIRARLVFDEFKEDMLTNG